MIQKEAQQPWVWSRESKDITEYKFFRCLISKHITALICSQGEKGFRLRHLQIYLFSCQAAFEHNLLTHIVSHTFSSNKAQTHTLYSFATVGHLAGVCICSRAVMLKCHQVQSQRSQDEKKPVRHVGGRQERAQNTKVGCSYCIQFQGEFTAKAQ